uniref:Thioredoxin domain-containing protein n=3 Tax=Octopus bimaculoides TaxID=37653 RepID=A0A0L8HRR4_OCTBM
MAGRQFSRLIPLCRNIPKHRISFLATRCLHQRSMLSGAKSQLLLITSNKQIKPYSSAAALECINIQDESDFEKRVLDSPKPVIVDFHAS